MVPPKRAQTIDPTRHDPSEIVFKFHEGTKSRLSNERLMVSPSGRGTEDLARLSRRGLSETKIGRDIQAVNKLLGGYPDAVIVPLFGRDPDAMETERLRLEPAVETELADLGLYFMVISPLISTRGAPGPRASRACAAKTPQLLLMGPRRQ